MIHLNKEKTLKMFEINNMELLNKLYSDKKSVFLALGHTASWELTGMILPLLTKYETYGIYLPLKNSYFDKHIKDIRGKFGLELIPSQQIFRFLYHKKNDLVLTYILADQSPPKNSDNYWVNFLNQDTAFSKGLEKMSKSLNYAVVFLNIVKIKRGRYLLDFELICENPQLIEINEISDLYVKKLENLINNHPENWLWSHRRWKHKREILND